MRIFIPGNVPSLKTSQVKTARGIFPSKAITRYLRGLGIKSYSSSKKVIVPYKTKYPYIFEEIVAPMREELNKQELPYRIGFYFVRGSRHKFDWLNACHIVCDLLTAADVIADDNMDVLVPYPCRSRIDPLTWYGYDKHNPGVWLYFSDYVVK